MQEMPIIREEYSAFEHLTHAIGAHSPETLFAMLTAYFDESHEDQFGMTFVCGWLASVEQWQRFEYDWKLFLAKNDVPYFHMEEFAHSIGPFAKWKNKSEEGTRRKFMRTAADIIIDTIQRGFVCVISDQMFEECDDFYELRTRFGSPYALAGRTCANLVVEWASTATTFPRSDIEYVFEDGGPDKGGLLYAMQEVPPCLSAPIFKPGRDQKPTNKWPNGKAGMVQLQAADYLAYELSKFARDLQAIKANPSRFRASLGILPQGKVKRMFFTSTKFDIMCKMLKIKRRDWSDDDRPETKRSGKKSGQNSQAKAGRTKGSINAQAASSGPKGSSDEKG